MEDLNNVSSFFEENDLIINLKKGKTESLLFGTAKRLAKTSGVLDLQFNEVKINSTKRYKYLGILLDPNLTFSEHFNKSYKKASSRLRLLHRLKPYLTLKAATTIYKSFVLPLVNYCGVINLSINKGQLDKFKSLESRGRDILSSFGEISKIILPKIKDMIEKRACLLVRQCIDGKLCVNFRNYFEVLAHSKNTRNNKSSIKIPKVKLEFARKGFYFMGAKIYNLLPNELRCKESYSDFKNCLMKLYS